PRAMVTGIGGLFRTHWPELFGLEPQPLTDFGIESRVHQGLAGAAWLLVPVFAIPILRIASLRRAPAERGSRESGEDFCRYLVITAALSLAGYLVGRCGVVDFYTMRYELLSILGACGLAGWYVRRERSAVVR